MAFSFILPLVYLRDFELKTIKKILDFLNCTLSLQLSSSSPLLSVFLISLNGIAIHPVACFLPHTSSPSCVS